MRLSKSLKEWALLAMTALLVVILKELHFAVTHYNVFLSILLGWGALLVGFFGFVFR
ncbi:hypothetical protein [Thermodesulforhabdus norvegica]|uniref:Uncharacterized protein n=1 Tax=Thermodesulforhabdus norvegica TaxID=39841 RepID=A0A1I4R310_9BACT|nr:hypothetical protein [Thermodesulforhabdus norvegica]SFM46336.1 hypothetical protein SAMN05660836_00354 [Thermodesulforhabdus norvegica]